MKKQKIKLNKKQQQTVDLIQSGVNVFLTGDAGTGKTTVIQQSVKGLEKDGKNVLITATTVMRALLVLLQDGSVKHIISRCSY